jgi:hypothetical protein
MKTVLAVRICEGIGATGMLFVVCANSTEDAGNIIANPRDATANLIFSMVPTFLCLP